MNQQPVNRDRLQRHLVFAEFFGADDQSFGGSYRAQSGDQGLARHQHHDYPGRHMRHPRHPGQHDKRGHHDQLVGHRVEEFAERADRVVTAREIAVKIVANRGDEEHSRRRP